MENDRKMEVERVQRNLLGLSKSLNAIAATTLGMAGIAYFVGFVGARSYYSKFGGHWIVKSMSTTDILEFCAIPIGIYLFAFGIAYFASIVEVKESKSGRDWISSFFLYLMIPIGILSISTIWIKVDWIRIISTFVSLIFWAVFFAHYFSARILKGSSEEQEQIETRFRFIWVFALTGLYQLPYTTYSTLGESESRFESNKLPYVQAERFKGKVSKLIYSNENHLYCAVYDTTSKKLTGIEIIGLSEAVVTSKW